MMVVRFLIAWMCFCCLMSMAAAGIRNAPSPRPLSPRGELEFIPNHGQILTPDGQQRPDVLFMASGSGATCFLGQTRFQYVQRDSTRSHRIDVSFIGANPSARIEMQDTTPGELNYYLNGTRVEGVRAVRRLIYHDLYPRIDLVLYSTGASMKYDFVVHPGGDPRTIVMRYAGMKSLTVLKDGRCRATTSLGTIDELRPYTYQTVTEPDLELSRQARDVETRRVQSAFIRSGSDIAFRIGSYDRTRDLVIDPQRLWATYYGDNSERGWCVQTDGQNNVVMCGETNSSAKIASTGAYQNGFMGELDAFIVKFNSSGVRQWGTYYGGPNTDRAFSLAINGAGSIFIAGYTHSPTGIATAGAHLTTRQGTQDLFLASFSANGQIKWATYFGGNDIESMDFGNGVSMLSNGNVAIIGRTWSTTGVATANAHKELPGPAGTVDGIMGVFDDTGVLQWSTFVGGDGYDMLSSVNPDYANDRIIVSGSSYSTNGISTLNTPSATIATTSDAFVMSFDNDGVRRWGRYFGGSGGDGFLGTSCDATGSIYACGQISSADNVATAGAHSPTYKGNTDGCLVKFNTNGQLMWATYYGGVGTDDSWSVVAHENVVYIAGNTSSVTDIATSDAMQPTSGGGDDAYLAAFSPIGDRIWGTYYGGDKDDEALHIAIDGQGAIYFSGSTESESNISTAGAHQTVQSGSWNAMLVKICDVNKPLLSVSPDTTFCYGEQATIQVVPGGVGTRWYEGSTLLTAFNDSSRCKLPLTLSVGTHPIWVEVIGSNCTVRSDTLQIQVYEKPTLNAMNDTVVCKATTLQMNATAVGGRPPYNYLWSPSSGLDNPNIKRPVAIINDSTVYRCVVTDANGCTATDSVIIRVHPKPTVNLQRLVLTCPSDSIRIGELATSGFPPYTYVWSPPDGLSSPSIARPYAAPSATTLYNVTITDAHGCTIKDSVEVRLRLKPLPMITPSGRVVMCGTDSVVLRADKGYVSYVWNLGGTADSVVVKTAGKYVVSVTDADGCRGRSDTVTVVRSVLAPPVISGPDAACLNSIVDYTVSGDPTNSYAWSVANGGTLVSAVPPQKATIHWTTSGTWPVSVEVTNTDGCIATTSMQVVVADSLYPAILPTGPITLCKDGNIVLRASKGFLTYEWSTGAISDSIMVTASGSYSVKVLGQGGCSGSSDAVAVNVLTNPPPKPRIIASKRIVCVGDSAVLSLSPSSFVSYAWSDGSVADSTVVRSSGLYWAIVVDASGCSGSSDTIEIRTVALPTASITASGPMQFCEGGSVTLEAPSGPFSYLWSTGSTARTIVATASGEYEVRVTTSEGCAVTAKSIVTVFAKPTAVITGADAVCFSTSGVYDVPATTSNIVWRLLPNGLGTIASGQGTTSVVVDWGTTPGVADLSVVITNDEGCIDSATRRVQVNAELHPTITTSGPTTFCEGDSVTLGVSGYASYQWSNASGEIANATSSTYTVHATGQYSCFVTNAAGCTGTSDVVPVLVHPLPPLPVISVSGNVLISTTATTYQWALENIPISGATSQTLARTSAGWYTVAITDANGCHVTSAPFFFGANPRVTIAVDVIPLTPPDTTVDVPITLLGSAEVDVAHANHYVGKLRYNGSMILPISTSGGTITLPDQPIVGGTSRYVAFAGDRGTITQGVLQTIRFVTLLGNDTCSRLELFEVAFTDAPVDVNLLHGTFCESGICFTDGEVRLIDGGVRLALQPIYPNPALDRIHVTYTLNEVGQTQLLLTDLLGRTVREMVNEHQSQGEHAADLDVSTVSRGWYRIVLKTPSSQRHQHLIIGDTR